MAEPAHALRSIPLFQNLDDEALAEIAGLQIERRFPKDAVIFEEGTLGDYMYLIHDGEVKVTKMSEDGREKILEILGPGDFFGEMSVLDREPRSASIKTTRPCLLLALSRADFLGLLRRNTDMSMQLIIELSRRIRDADEQIRGLLFERVEARTRRLLERMATEPVPERSDLLATPRLTHQQLADLVGTSRETITRVLKELRDQGWLEQKGKQYLVTRIEPGRPA